MAAELFSFDALIDFVRAQHPDGDALIRVGDAVVTAAELGERADALIGYFVDQARVSGASWAQIGAAMGVTRQAAQKRFTGREDALPLTGEIFGRFAPRARAALLAAHALGEESGAEEADASHLVVAAVADSGALATHALRRLGLERDTLYSALGCGPAPVVSDPGPRALQDLQLTPAVRSLLRAALQVALRFHHNYIGTEHLLLAGTEDRVLGPKLAAVGLTTPLLERAVAVAIAEVRLALEQGGP